MREIITHPMYRALRTAAERKAAFHQYIDKEAKRERVSPMTLYPKDGDDDSFIHLLVLGTT